MYMLSLFNDLWFNVNVVIVSGCFFFFFSSRRRHTRCSRDWSSDVCSSDLFHFSGKLDTFDWEVYWSEIVARLLAPALLLHFALVFPGRSETTLRSAAKLLADRKSVV